MADITKPNTGDESFAALFEKSLTRGDDFEPGDKVDGVIAGISRDTIFVDISGKSEATIEASEFLQSDGTLSVKAGDKISAWVLASGMSGVELTCAIGRGKVNAAVLHVAKQNGIPIEGLVSAKVNGGFTVMIDGIRAFCPVSQIDRKFSENDKDYLGKKFLFSITEIKGRGDCIVSRRSLIEKVQKESEETLKKSLNQGDIVNGSVSRVAEFGVFVDIGGIEGLVPRSELSRSRSVQTENFRLGQPVYVKIITLDWETRKHSFSIKQTEADPWSMISLSEGQTVDGKIVNIIKSGAFMEVSSGIEGFIPISKMSYTKRINKPEDVVSIGETVTAKVITIDSKERRISLELITNEQNPWAEGSASLEVQECTIESVKSAGIVVRAPNGMEGFVPRGELLCDRNADLNKIYKENTTIRLVTKELKKEEKRLILSQKEVEKMEERENMKQYLKNDAETESSIGSLFGSVLGDLKKKLDSN